MLIELKVSNFAIIENIHIQFKKGLNILSGETGAGKSVLLKSLSLLMGTKGSVESIRTGSHQASIEGSFDISKRDDLQEKMNEMGIPCEDGLLVVRRVLAEEKSRVYLNGTLSTLQNLRDIVSPLIEVAGHSAPLIEMTGQHENRHLLSTAYHLDLLDQYAGVWESRLLFQEKYARHMHMLQEIEQIAKEAMTRQQRLDFLIFQRDEIKALNLRLGEEAAIEAEMKRLKSSSKLSGFVENAESALSSDDDSAISRIHAIIQKSGEISLLDPAIGENLKNLSQAKTLIEDSLYDLRHYLSKIETDPARLDKLQERLSDLRKLQKKYGPKIEDILARLAEFEIEISLLENSESRLDKLKEENERLMKDLQKIATEMSKKRRSGAKLLADSVNDELLDLNMKGVTFHVQAQTRNELNSSGLDDIEFMSQTSPKDPPKSLGKFASGGELSRILLSLKRVLI